MTRGAIRIKVGGGGVPKILCVDSFMYMNDEQTKTIHAII